MNEQLLPGNGVMINVARGGKQTAPLLFFAHGIASWWQTFAAQLEFFGQHHALAATDLRGCGRSAGGPDLRYRLDEYIADNAAVLGSLLKDATHQPAILVGHSYGGLITLALAPMFGPRVLGVVMIDPPLFFYEHGIGKSGWPKFFGRVQQLIRDGGNEDGVTRLLQARLPHLPEPALRSRAAHLLRLEMHAIDVHVAGHSVGSFDLSAAANAWRGPLLMLHGDFEKHGAVREADFAWLRARCPQVEMQRFAGAGHVVHETHAAGVNDALSVFVNRLTGLQCANV